MEKTFLRGYPSTRTSACFGNIPCEWGEMEDKAPETKKTHICRAQRLRDRPSIIKFITGPKKKTRRNLLQERYKKRPSNEGNC